VSEECAVAMATGAAEQLGADYALAVTGFAGPCGGANENPVGTILHRRCTPARRVVEEAQLSRSALRREGAGGQRRLDWLRRELANVIATNHESVIARSGSDEAIQNARGDRHGRRAGLAMTAIGCNNPHLPQLRDEC
jgi:hypothetical protein